MRMTKSRARKRMAVLLFVFISFMLVKSIWVMCATSGHGSDYPSGELLDVKSGNVTAEIVG